MEPARDIIPITSRKKTAASRLSLSKRTIDALTLPVADGPKPVAVWHYDTTPRLALAVWSNGSKSWFWVGKLAGRKLQKKIGNFPEWSPERAREKAGEISEMVGKKIDPRKVDKEARNEPTLQKLFDDYLENHAKPHKRTWKEDEKQYNRYLKKWKSRRISDVTKADVIALKTRMGKDNGTYAANRCLSLISKIYTHAVDIGHDVPNPAKGVKKFDEESRERFMQPDEVSRFFEALEKENQLFQDFFEVLLLTGSRSINVKAMRFDEIDFEKKTWRMPRTKNKKPLTVPLVDAAMEILQRRLNEAKGRAWVFEGGKRNQSGHLTDPKFAWKRVCKNAKLDDLTIHDLRRSLGSWMAATGASLPMIGRQLGHLNQVTTQVYARMNTDGIRGAVNVATAALLKYKGKVKSKPAE